MSADSPPPTQCRRIRWKLWARFALGFGGLILAMSLIGNQRVATGIGLESIGNGGELVVLTRNAPTTYFEDRDEQMAGFEHDLAVAFGKQLGVPVRFVVKDTLNELFAALEANQGHLIAAGITRTDARTLRFGFGASYQTVQQQVVCNRDRPIPARPADLAGRKLMVIAGSSYIDSLVSVRATLPELAWVETDDHATEQLLEAVAHGAQDCTVADSNIVAINRRYYPELAVAFPLGEAEPLAWVIPSAATGLRGEIDRFIAHAEDTDLLAVLYERYYGHIDVFDYVDMQVFRRRVAERLPAYRSLFEEAARQNELPWTLLAAQAYQESHWDPAAKSPTGVRGMMMLTKPTARAMGVDDRLDAAQSIAGGARYLASLRERLGRDVLDPDERLWQTLAAYNIGMGHLADARGLAGSQRRNPNRWHELKDVLPRLSERPFFRDLKHGYARGEEAVRYVQRVRDYEQVLRELTR